MGHVTMYIGGVYQTLKTYDQEGVVYETVAEKDQRRAMEFLQKHAFSTPSWAYNKDILDRINMASSVETFRSVQGGVLRNLLNPSRIGRLIEGERRENGDSYTVFEMMDDTRNGVFKELRAYKNINVHRRHLQRVFIEQMDYLLNEEPNFGSVDVSQSDIRPAVRNQLKILQRDINNRINAGNINRSTRVHLEDINHRIDELLTVKK